MGYYIYVFFLHRSRGHFFLVPCMEAFPYQFTHRCRGHFKPHLIYPVRSPKNAHPISVGKILASMLLQGRESRIKWECLWRLLTFAEARWARHYSALRCNCVIYCKPNCIMRNCSALCRDCMCIVVQKPELQSKQWPWLAKKNLSISFDIF